MTGSSALTMPRMAGGGVDDCIVGSISISVTLRNYWSVAASTGHGTRAALGAVDEISEA